MVERFGTITLFSLRCFCSHSANTINAQDSSRHTIVDLIIIFIMQHCHIYEILLMNPVPPDEALKFSTVKIAQIGSKFHLLRIRTDCLKYRYSNRYFRPVIRPIIRMFRYFYSSWCLERCPTSGFHHARIVQLITPKATQSHIHLVCEASLVQRWHPRQKASGAL